MTAAGRQPIANETGDVVVIHNGEIYNFRALRRTLETAGHVFASHTDSEVIGLEGDVITTNDIAAFEYQDEDVHGRISGIYKSAHAVPKFQSRLVYYGLDRAWAEAMRQI